MYALPTEKPPRRLGVKYSASVTVQLTSGWLTSQKTRINASHVRWHVFSDFVVVNIAVVQTNFVTSRLFFSRDSASRLQADEKPYPRNFTRALQAARKRTHGNLHMACLDKLSQAHSLTITWHNDGYRCASRFSPCKPIIISTDGRMTYITPSRRTQSCAVVNPLPQHKPRADTPSFTLRTK